MSFEGATRRLAGADSVVDSRGEDEAPEVDLSNK